MMNQVDAARLDEAAVITKETDRLLAHALEASRSISDLDSRSISLMVVSLALLVISVLDTPPSEIDLVGFKLVSINWLSMVLPLAATTLYLAMHLLLRWWSEQQLWYLQAAPSIIESRNKVIELISRHDVMNSEWLKTAERFQRYVLSPEYIIPQLFDYAHPEPKCDPPDVVRTELEARFAAAYEKLRKEGIFQHMSEEHWVASMRCAIESEVKLAALGQPGVDPDYSQRHIVHEERIAKQGEHGRHIMDAPPSLELQHNESVMLYCRRAAGRISTLLRISKLRIWSVLVVPLALVVIALGAMLVQIYMRYAPAWMH